MTDPGLEQLGRAWVRNGARARNQQLVSCGRILLDRLGVTGPPATEFERNFLREALASVLEREPDPAAA